MSVERLVAAHRKDWSDFSVSHLLHGEDITPVVWDDLSTEVAPIDDAAFAEGLMRHIGWGPEIPSAAYRNQLIELADGGLCIAGIRFRDGDRRRPFVDVFAFEGPPSSEYVRFVAGAVLQRWSMFNCRVARLPIPHPVDVSSPYDGTTVDQVVLAGRLSELTQQPAPGRASELSVERARTGEFWSFYETEMQDLLKNDADSREYTRMEDKDDLLDTVRSGLLFEAVNKSDGIRLGLMAMPAGARHGLRGFRVQELLIGSKYRGQGFAPALEWIVFRQLPDFEDAVVFGTIDGRNGPSLNSALRVGRRPVRAWMWVSAA